MKLCKLIFAFALVTLVAGFVWANDTASSAPILPKDFGGWQISGSSRTSNDPAVADPVNAAVLKEYGFGSFESATYSRDDGRKLTVRAARFGDASGAYGAYTYYKTPEMLIEKVGDGAASMNERVLFYRGNILVDAIFQKLSAMSAAELRELAQDLPLPAGNTRNLPGLPAYLPPQSYVKNTAKYVLGSVALQNLDAPVPASLVDFSSGAEVVLGNYNSSGGEATLMLISYPTPQIAADHLRRIEASTPQNNGSVASSAPMLANPIFDKRTGPILVVVAGPLSQAEAKSLLAAVRHCNLRLNNPRPIDEAISSAGGVDWSELDDYLMLRQIPGVFCAGEMIDWDAPTGGYLLQGCYATGKIAGEGAVKWIAQAAEA